MSSIASRPAPSALQNLLQQHPIPPTSAHEPHQHHLALQIAHNLRFQHGWTGIRLHYTSTNTSSASTPAHPLPRPLISGLPPQRLYIHPDEQIALLQEQNRAGKTGMPVPPAEREWVLPSHLREKWTLRRFGEVFDCVGISPESWEGRVVFGGGEDEGEVDGEDEGNHWRRDKPKRVLLATLDDDSTVVYYIVHDGIVKPRQN